MHQWHMRTSFVLSRSALGRASLYEFCLRKSPDITTLKKNKGILLCAQIQGNRRALYDVPQNDCSTGCLSPEEKAILNNFRPRVLQDIHFVKISVLHSTGCKPSNTFTPFVKVPNTFLSSSCLSPRKEKHALATSSSQLQSVCVGIMSRALPNLFKPCV